MTSLPHRFPQYGTVGLLVLLLMQTAVYCNHTDVLPDVPWPLITTWATPVCWWSYILIIDAWIFRRKGTSLLTARRQQLALQCILSIAFWCVFEAYNRMLPGWRYVNLDSNLAVRFTGYAIAYATILPGMYLTCELIRSYGAFRRVPVGGFRWSQGALTAMMLVGLVCCVAPPFFPPDISRYLWAPVWVGWFLMLEPINYRRGLPSLLRDWEHGNWSRTLQLAVTGVLCGLLWEFWNMWAYTKWEYVFFPPALAKWKYFEMPLLGFLGFIPFVFDYFAMFHFLASFFTREDKLGL